MQRKQETQQIESDSTLLFALSPLSLSLLYTN